MKIVIAPQSFKGTLSARKVADAMAEGVRRVSADTETVLLPMADGGEGTVDALVSATGGRTMREQVTGPLGETVTASWGILGDGARASFASRASMAGMAADNLLSGLRGEIPAYCVNPETRRR